MSVTVDPTRLQRRSEASLVGAGASRQRQAPSAARIARRRMAVGITKWALPAFALALLGSIAAWPEIARLQDQGRVAFRRVFAVDPESGQMRQPHYRGVDQRGRPYTLTATSALQTSAERIELAAPRGDVVTEAGTWLLVEADTGVFIQHRSLLDLAREVVLYREDGTTLRTDTAALDMKAGAAASNDRTHAEGPFGTLDAQGFTLTEKGASIQFQGPAHLVMNGATPRAAPAPATTTAPVTTTVSITAAPPTGARSK